MSHVALRVSLPGGFEVVVLESGEAAIEAGCTLECGHCYRYASECFHRAEVPTPIQAWHLVAAFWPLLSEKERQRARSLFDEVLRGEPASAT